MTEITSDKTEGKSASKTRLAPQVRELLQDRNGNLLVWFRSPKTGTKVFCRFFSIQIFIQWRKQKNRSNWKWLRLMNWISFVCGTVKFIYWLNNN